MSPRQAVRILMLSPIYFRLRPIVRWQLVQDYCRMMNNNLSSVGYNKG
jgi:hypothetical protein